VVGPRKGDVKALSRYDNTLYFELVDMEIGRALAPDSTPQTILVKWPVTRSPAIVLFRPTVCRPTRECRSARGPRPPEIPSELRRAVSPRRSDLFLPVHSPTDLAAHLFGLLRVKAQKAHQRQLDVFRPPPCTHDPGRRMTFIAEQ